jgi:hypothetical protein
MRTIPLIVLVTLAATSGGWAGEYESFFDQYLQRIDTITLGAGNAKDVNAAIHVIDPWPRHSGNRRIPANGARMTGAIQRYRANANSSGRPDSQGGQATPGAASAIGNSPLSNAPQ